MRPDENVVAVLDILGYSRLMEALSLDELEDIVVRTVLGSVYSARLVSGEAVVVDERGALQEFSRFIEIEYGVISDTIILYPKPRAQRPLTTLCTTVAVLMRELLSAGILLRGGIAVDTFRAIPGHPIYIGRAMVGAHRIEMGQDWSGCAVSGTVGRRFPFEMNALRHDGVLVRYPIPFKPGTSRKLVCGTAVNWMRYRIGGKGDPERILRRLARDSPDEARGKIGATIEFLRAMKSSGLASHRGLQRYIFDRSRVKGTYRLAPGGRGWPGEP